ncbi:hypothetical protein N7457_003887 [Penicillium paradoxum]|uniref:uncharacterized protein n=1 Tax=Penicillium paradoxum TaxID=176176 RepID=UPI0025488D99|nr:uncharacterized protein N7457_003887 [Penicillium paradoxum]KAJ5782113.1 hypothetical protein N7457_003887 [Penicillium paradoxum]
MTRTQVPYPSPATLKRFPHIHDDPSTISHTLDPFTITTQTGFLPYETAPVDLPEAFSALLSLVNRLPVVRLDGKPGLLATYELGPAVKAELTDLTDEVEKLVLADGSPDRFTIAAVFRDYTFLASSYLLEPCWEHWNKNPEGGYGLGRDVLPKSVARPMYRCAEILNLPPFMSYAASYALFNYTVADPAKGLSEYSNLRLIRSFERGLDPKSSEAGFILTHVDMVKETGPLIGGVLKVVDSLEQHGSRQEINDGFREILKSMEKIEESMEGKSLYWTISVKSPCPKPPLTKILHEFRAYRPLPHREFLTYIREKSEEIGVQKYAVQDSETAVLFLRTLNHIRSFRWRHWLFAREYIIRRTPHPTATGGSPIVTWLPNQLSAVMELMVKIYDTHLAPSDVADSDADLVAVHRKQVEPMMELVRDQKEKLAREVERWCQERGV